jgi:hypothetical protein
VELCQEIQRRFPDLQALSTDLRIANDRLIAYRKKMRILAFQEGWRGLAWKSRISKAHVLVLREIVSDIGADRGILLAEHGAQSGAREAAVLTNV